MSCASEFKIGRVCQNQVLSVKGSHPFSNKTDLSVTRAETLFTTCYEHTFSDTRPQIKWNSKGGRIWVTGAVISSSCVSILSTCVGDKILKIYGWSQMIVNGLICY